MENLVATRLVFRTEYTGGDPDRRTISTGTRYGSNLTPDQFAQQLVDVTRVQRPHLNQEFMVTVWEEDADAEVYNLRDAAAPSGAVTVIAPAVRYKSKKCSSGECTHAARGEYCTL
jgi:hypothetical protein